MAGGAYRPSPPRPSRTSLPPRMVSGDERTEPRSCSDPHMNQTRRYNEMVAARDGVELATDLFFPAGDGPHPAVVVRTPYNKNMPLVTKVVEPWNGRGYAVVVQDVRGRGDS